jgi:serine/threonine protein kinase
MVSIDDCNCVGKQIGNYTLESVLGTGRFACVYLAKHNHLNYWVACKILDPGYLKSYAEAEEDFRKEAQILQKLKHPHILSFLDFGKSEGTFYIVTEYVPGETLRKSIAGTSLTTGQVVTVLTQVGEAVYTVHEQDIIHCDLKPENILLRKDNGAILADFGIAIELPSGSNGTPIPHIRGTYPYIAPEQFSGVISKKSDQYSLGCVAYELFTEGHPFEHITILQSDEAVPVERRHKSKLPPKLKDLSNNVPEHIKQAILKAMAEEPEERHDNVDEFIQSLQPSTNPPAGINYHTTRPQTPDPAQALLDLQLPNDVQDFQDLLSLLRRLRFTVDVSEIENQYTSERRRYTRVENDAGLHRALVHIPNWILDNPTPANQSAIASMCFAFDRNSLVIILLKDSEYPSKKIRQIVEKLWKERGQVRGKFVPRRDIKELISQNPNEQKKWINDLLEFQNVPFQAVHRATMPTKGELFLDPVDRKRIVDIIKEFIDETHTTIKFMLLNCPVPQDNIDFSLPALDLARDIVMKLEKLGRLYEKYHALGSLLSGARDEVNDSDLKDEIDGLITKYHLVEESE